MAFAAGAALTVLLTVVPWATAGIPTIWSVFPGAILGISLAVYLEGESGG